MTMSPRSRSSPSRATVRSVMSPAGSMTHTARGFPSGSTRLLRSTLALFPSLTRAAIAAGFWSNTTHWCPPRARRRTMLPPMRPSPTMPSCISLLPMVAALPQRLPDRFLERRQAGRHMGAEMHAHNAPPALRQHLEVAARLRRLDDAEAVGLIGDRKIVGIVAGDLKEDAGIGPAFVGLAGRMEETRAEADAGRHPFAIADHQTDVPQDVAVKLVAFDIGENPAIISCLDSRQMSAETFHERRRLAECGAVLRVGKKAQAILLEQGRFRRKPTALFVSVGELPGLHLARLDVGLVERIDAEDRPRDRRGDFPAEEFLSDVMALANRDAHDRMAGLLQRRDGLVLLGIRFGGEPQIGEDPVLTIGLRACERLGVERNKTLAALAGRFRHQLLEPRPEIGNAGRGHDGDLVAA